MRRIPVTVAAVLCLATVHANQTGTPPTSIPSAAELDRIVTRVLESSAHYLQTFRNLAAEETKDLEQFDKSGRVTKRRRIVGDLLVYQATRGAAEAVKSRFGILTPTRISYGFHQRTGGTKQKPSITLTSRMTFTYSAFRRFQVATDETIAAPH
jgi:hypothetical protein